MRRKSVGLAAILILAAAAPAVGQRPASFELYGFGTWTKFDESLVFKDRFGAGGLLGFFIAKNIALEGDASFTRTHFDNGLPGKFSYVPVRARLAAHLPLGSSHSRLILSAGYVAALYRDDVHENDDGFTGLVGLKFALTRHLSLRTDGIIDYVPTPFNGASSNLHYTVRAGLSMLLGSYPPNQDSIRADSIQRAERARADSVQRAERARADSTRMAEQARADSIQRAAARADSLRQVALQDSLLAAKRAREDSLRQAARVDSTQMRLMLQRKKNLVLQGVTFEFNQSRLTLDAKKVLDFVAQSLKDNPTATVEVGGYTDSKGSETYNQQLSLSRARAVRAYLVQQGVPADQLTAAGYGESRPVASNATEEGRAQNRRVELKRVN
jgi:outer membrane protein OmpA-like peptidoglycan-associated protein/opacity protein-like surface antigen